MKVKEISNYGNGNGIDELINEFISENDIFVIDIKYTNNDATRYAYIHYYEETDLRKLKIEKLIKEYHNVSDV